MTDKIDKQIQEVTGNSECKTNENYNDMCKNVVEKKEINVESDKDDFVEVEFSNEALLTNVNQLEREYEESIQRVKFSRGVVVGEENASRMYLGDVWSTNNCPLIFCASGKSRWNNNKVVLPSAWSERENVKCYEKYCDERNRERQTEIFKVNRDYEILVQSLCIEREEQIDSPSKIEIDNYFDDTCINNNNLPDVLMSIVNEYDEKINYLMLYENTYGDRIEITNVDRFYESIGNNGMKYYVDKGYYTNDSHMLCINEIEMCYVQKRLIFDDGG